MRVINTLTVAVTSIGPNTELSLVNDSSSSITISGNYKLINSLMIIICMYILLLKGYPLY